MNNKFKHMYTYILQLPIDDIEVRTENEFKNGLPSKSELI
jgi:hypothetical protein